MAHITSRKGGRAWFGKREAKAAGKVTRRQDRAAEILAAIVEDGKEYDVPGLWDDGVCVFCGALLWEVQDGDDQHSDDCLWRHAATWYG